MATSSTKVINFFAGPGAGKSTAAAGLFFYMKCRGYKVELVTEYAKDLYYMDKLGHPTAGNAWVMQNVQHERQRRLLGKVDYIITDSPLLKDIVYAHYTLKGDELERFKAECQINFACFDNFNVWVNRVKTYQPYGRRESEESARSVDLKMLEQVHQNIHYTVAGDEHAPAKVLRALECVVHD
jgi:ATP:corrinoid adenosyltransferase